MRQKQQRRLIRFSSSDEKGEIFPECVTNYAFVNRAEEDVSLACVPLLLRKDELVDNGTTQVFLSCVCDEGLRKIYKEVVGWRYEISYVRPEISVLCKGSGWTKLVLLPKRLYEAVSRSILITVHCLHFVKHNPEAAEEHMWSQLSKVFSSYEVPPSENDCMNHIPLIRDAADSDPVLKDSKEHVLAKWTTERRCAACRRVEDWDYNKIIICNQLSIAFLFM